MGRTFSNPRKRGNKSQKIQLLNERTIHLSFRTDSFSWQSMYISQSHLGLQLEHNLHSISLILYTWKCYFLCFVILPPFQLSYMNPPMENSSLNFYSKRKILEKYVITSTRASAHAPLKSVGGTFDSLLPTIN